MREKTKRPQIGRRYRIGRQPKTPETEKLLTRFMGEIAAKLRLEREREPSEHTLTAYRLAALKILEATAENPIIFSTKKGRSSLIILRAVFSHLKSLGMLPEHLQNSVPGLPNTVKIKTNKEAQKQAREKKWIHPQEFKSFLKCFPVTKEGKLMRRFCAIVYATGLRKSEALNLTRQDIREEKTRIVITVREGKGKKNRVVLVSKKHRAIFLPWKPIDLTVSQINRFFDKARRAAGHPEWTIHGLRHSFASNFSSVCDDIYALKAMLGHESLETTLLYTHTSIEDKKDMDAIIDRLTW